MGPEVFVIFTRPFWLDEWHTVLVARRDSLAQVFSDLHRGSDFGPPLTHVVAWVVGKTIGIGELPLRIVAFLCVLAGLALLFLTLRRRFDVIPSIVGTLAVASHKLVVNQSVEWRFYAPWVLFSAALAWSLTLDGDRERSRRRDVAIALSSVGLVTGHWFGVLTLGLMCAFAAASFGVARWREGVRRVAPAAVGLVVLALCLPLVLGQRGAIVEKSWIPDVTPRQLLAMLKLFLGAFVPVAGVVLILVAWLRSAPAASLRAAGGQAIRDPSVLALLSGAVLPFVLAVISLKQPAMLDRYAITTLLAWAPLLAFATQHVSAARAPRLLLLVWLVGLTGVRVLRVAREHRIFRSSVGAAQYALAEGCGRGIPVVFQVRHLMYPAMRADSISNCDARYLAMSNTTLDAMYPAGSMQPRFFKVENEFSALHERLYDFPRVVREETLDTTSVFLLVAWDESLPIGYKNIERFRAAVFSQHEVVRLSNDLALFRKR